MVAVSDRILSAPIRGRTSTAQAALGAGGGRQGVAARRQRLAVQLCCLALAGVAVQRVRGEVLGPSGRLHRGGRLAQLDRRPHRHHVVGVVCARVHRRVGVGIGGGRGDQDVRRLAGTLVQHVVAGGGVHRVPGQAHRAAAHRGRQPRGRRQAVVRREEVHVHPAAGGVLVEECWAGALVEECWAGALAYRPPIRRVSSEPAL